MPNSKNILGVVLAGGMSVRMGCNKALLSYKNRPLIEYMMDILRDSGIQEVVISGSWKEYACIEDRETYGGPAAAIISVLEAKPGYSGYIFVPVDMPLLVPKMITKLIMCKKGGYFAGSPLPIFITPPFNLRFQQSVKDFINTQGIQSVVLPKVFSKCMMNVNTPQEWQQALERL